MLARVIVVVSCDREQVDNAFADGEEADAQFGIAFRLFMDDATFKGGVVDKDRADFAAGIDQGLRKMTGRIITREVEKRVLV